jgi:hypothetical protein
MPPGTPLEPESVALIERWIGGGARWPDAVAPATAGGRSQHWAFHPPRRPEVPRTDSDWARGPIDHFVAQKLRDAGLRPAAEADRASLIRRLAFDLTGLPASAGQVQHFVQDPDARAYEKLVEQYLASPRYGERWGRRWLDLVRYADTAGFEIDPYIPDAWRYRDYVIESFNQDKPYDRFLREQIAGDEFFPEDPVAQTGTGLFCIGPNRDLYPDQADINRTEILTDYTDTVASVFLGLAAGCARCHDHKFDPIPQRDYYRLQAVFAPAVKTKVALNRLTSLGFEVAENVREIKLREIGEEIGVLQTRCRTLLLDDKLRLLPQEVQTALRLDDPRRTARQRELATVYASRVRIDDDQIRACLDAGEAKHLRAIEKRLVDLFANYRAKPFACGITDVGDYAPKTLVPGKGGRTEEEVKPGFLSALGGGSIPDRSFARPTTGPIPLMPTTGRRHALAEWLTRPDHPLTARVMVNRVWQFHFGRGLVATPSDFGTRSRPPSHPELLDWLATEFVAHGWSVKHLHRLILRSATYRQSSNSTTEARAADPENVYLSRFSRRRLEAEEVRDAVLQATGSLNLRMGGRPVVPPLSKEELFNMIGRTGDAWVVTADVSEHGRRSAYLIQRRTFRMPMMEVFDAPETMVTCPGRDSSTTAPQSLTLLNGSFVVEEAGRLAARLVAAHRDDERAMIEAVWRHVLSRDPTGEEAASATHFLRAQRANTGSPQAALTELIRGVLNLNEFLYVD